MWKGDGRMSPRARRGEEAVRAMTGFWLASRERSRQQRGVALAPSQTNVARVVGDEGEGEGEGEGFKRG